MVDWLLETSLEAGLSNDIFLSDTEIRENNEAMEEDDESLADDENLVSPTPRSTSRKGRVPSLSSSQQAEQPQWTAVDSDCPVHLHFDSVPVHLLSGTIRQMINVTSRLKAKCLGSVSDSAITRYFLGMECSCIHSIQTYINDHLVHAGKPALETFELYEFFESFLMSHLYGGISFRQLHDNVGFLYLKPSMSHERLYEIINAVRGRTDDFRLFTMHPVMKRVYQYFGHQIRALASVEDGGFVSVDDDKLQLRSATVPENEGLLSIFQKNQSPGPTILAAVSVNTGLVLDLQPMVVDKTKQDCAVSVINHLAGVEEYGDKGDLRGIVISVDRGMFNLNLADVIASYKGHLVGTVPYNKACPFHLVDGPKSIRVPLTSQSSQPKDKIVVSKTGIKRIQWARTILPRSKKPLYEGLYRTGHGNKTVLIATTLENDLGPHNWSIESITSNLENYQPLDLAYYGVDRNKEDEDDLLGRARCLMNDKLQSFERYQLTTAQRTAEWFFLRTFRFTGAVAYQILLALSNQWFAEMGRFNEQNAVESVLDFLGFHVQKTGPTAPALRVNKTLKLDYNAMSKKTVVELKNVCKDNSITGYTTLNRSNLLFVVTGSHPPVECISSKLLNLWFEESSSNWRGANEVDSRKIGLANEKPVLRRFGQFLLDKSSGTRKLVCLKSVGLVVVGLPPEYGRIAVSADGIAVVSDESTSNKLDFGSIEIKTKTTAATIEESQELANTFGEFCCVSLHHDSSDEDYQNLNRLVPNIHHRAQLLHQSVVLHTPHSYYVEATTTEIIRVVLIHFPYDIKSNYFKCMSEIASIYSPWVNDESKLPELDLSSFHGKFDLVSLRDNLRLWRTLSISAFAYDQNKNVVESPLPPCSRIVPMPIAAHNKAKVGVDVLSRHLTNVHSTSTNNRLSSGIVLLERVFMCLAVNAFHCSQCVQLASEHTIDSAVRDFADLNDLRHHLNHRKGSFMNFLSTVYQYCRSLANANRVPATVEALGPQNQALAFTLSRSKLSKAQQIVEFSSVAGRRFRVSCNAHQPFIAANHRADCFVCSARSVPVRCVTCHISLCIGGIDAEQTCWKLFHSDADLNQICQPSRRSRPRNEEGGEGNSASAKRQKQTTVDSC